jgi:hypothetical protein
LANAVYPKYKNAILQGSANSALTGTGSTGLWAALIDTNDVSYNAAHEFYSDISAGVVAEIEVSTVTTTGGLIDGDNEVFSAVSGDPSEALIYYRKNAGANTTWRLVAFIDTGVTGLPVTPNGGDINLNHHASGIIQL